MSVKDAVVVSDGVSLRVRVSEKVGVEVRDDVSVGVRDGVSVAENVRDGVGEDEGERLGVWDGVYKIPLPIVMFAIRNKCTVNTKTILFFFVIKKKVPPGREIGKFEKPWN